MPSILDLYSGCGGFSLGAHQAGFVTKLAIDRDPILSGSFKDNFPGAQLLNADIRSVDRSAVEALLPGGVDGVVGGPPCQAFSEMGRRDKRDPRRKLIKEFFRIITLVRPKFFVFENVRGLGFTQNIHLLEAGLDMLPTGWRFIGPVLLNAADFGAPTRRVRLFMFGFRANEMDVPSESALLRKSNRHSSVYEAISDLLRAKSLGSNRDGFDIWAYDGRRKVSPYAKKMRTRAGSFTGHKQTLHTHDTLRRFSQLEPGKVDPIGKYIRLAWDGLCPTLRAGTGNDRGSYQAVRPIHPVEDRVITAREAARLQGFPDGFVFHPTVWHSCRMIGNSVSPILAKKLMQRIARNL
jgi:DNA (cytosine-5)-methyltransferase 1